jgi:hypothetical protein
MVRKPSQRLNDVLSGRVRLENEDESIQSWCSFFIHQGAVAIMNKPTREERQKALQRLPDAIRPHVQDRVLVLWDRRRSATP